MAYDTVLGERIKGMLANEGGYVEKHMFGGVAFMVNGNMACGVHKDRLIARIPTEDYSTSLSMPFVDVFDISGRPMAGWITVKPEGVASNEALRAWIQKAVAFARSLPSK